MSRDPIDTAKQMWNTLNRGVDRAMLVLFVVGMVVFPVVAVLDAIGLIAVFTTPPLGNLVTAGFMVLVGAYMLKSWLNEKLAEARALNVGEEEG